MWSTTLDIDGPVHVAEWGSGPARIVLLHGLGGSHLNWMRVAPQLTRHGRVLAPDLPGFGLSPVAGRRTTVAAYADLLDRFLQQACEGPAILVGNSMGGLIALAEGRRHPERVAGLVLVDAVLPTPWRRRRAPLLALAFWSYLLPPLGRWGLRRVRDRISVEDLVAGTLRLCAQHPDLIPADVVAAHVELERERGRSTENDAAYVEAAGSIGRALLERARLQRTIRRVTVPTLLVHGASDRLVRVDAARLAQRHRPDWELHVLDDVGHIPMLEVPHRLFEILGAWLPTPGLGTPPPLGAAEPTASQREGARP
jgi:pimeloyl-ACP methyl ester carboxylesterase